MIQIYCRCDLIISRMAYIEQQFLRDPTEVLLLNESAFELTNVDTEAHPASVACASIIDFSMRDQFHELYVRSSHTVGRIEFPKAAAVSLDDRRSSLSKAYASQCSESFKKAGDQYSFSGA